MTQPTFPDAKAEDAYRFIIKLGVVGHGVGVTPFRLESYLSRTAQALGLNGEFMSTLTSINFAIWQSDDLYQRTHFVTTSAPSFDMTRLAEVSDLVKQVEAGTVTLAEGSAALDDLDDKTGHPPTYNAALVGVGYALSSAGFAIMLSMSRFDALVAVVLSLVVYAIVLIAADRPALGRRVEVTSGLVVSVLASLLALHVPGSDAPMVTLCALVMLLPGFSLTAGMAELSTQHVVAGMQRLVSGVLTTFNLFLGATAGTLCVMQFSTIPDPATPPAMPAIWVFVPAIALVAGTAIVFQVRPKDFGWAVLGGVLAYCGVLVGNQFGFWQGSFVGAVTLGIFANIYAWLLGRPTSIVMLTAIMVLVPGAGAYRTLQAAATSGAASGLAAEWQVIINILAILCGVLVALTIVPRSRRCKLVEPGLGPGSRARRTGLRRPSFKAIRASTTTPSTHSVSCQSNV